MTGKVNSDEIHEPLWRPGFSPLNRLPVAPLPVVIEPAACRLNRLHRISLYVGLVYDPSQPGPDGEHQDNQTSHAKTYVSKASARDVVGKHDRNPKPHEKPFA